MLITCLLITNVNFKLESFLTLIDDISITILSSRSHGKNSRTNDGFVLYYRIGHIISLGYLLLQRLLNIFIEQALTLNRNSAKLGKLYFSSLIVDCSRSPSHLQSLKKLNEKYLTLISYNCSKA